jgi:hypothetical protein
MRHPNASTKFRTQFKDHPKLHQFHYRGFDVHIENEVEYGSQTLAFVATISRPIKGSLRRLTKRQNLQHRLRRVFKAYRIDPDTGKIKFRRAIQEYVVNTHRFCWTPFKRFYDPSFSATFAQAVSTAKEEIDHTLRYSTGLQYYLQDREFVREEYANK